MPTIALRIDYDTDLDTIFEFVRNPEAVHMAAFTTERSE